MSARCSVPPAALLQRRRLLASGVLLVAPLPAFSAVPGVPLPKDYVACVHALTASLTASLGLEVSASERVVRRAADPAKGDIERFLRDWKGAPAVQNEASYRAVVEALRQLGAFYAAKGPRAALPAEVRQAVLEQLATAEHTLPA